MAGEGEGRASARPPTFSNDWKPVSAFPAAAPGSLSAALRDGKTPRPTFLSLPRQIPLATPPPACHYSTVRNAATPFSPKPENPKPEIRKQDHTPHA